jgi:hypothetical protein
MNFIDIENNGTDRLFEVTQTTSLAQSSLLLVHDAMYVRQIVKLRSLHLFVIECVFLNFSLNCSHSMYLEGVKQTGIRWL